MDTGSVWDDFAALPAEGQKQAADYVALLRQRYASQKARESANATELSQEPFIGMWTNRSEMQDSAAWVREAREQEWSR